MVKVELLLKGCPFCSAKAEAFPWHGGGPNRILIGCSNEQCPAGPQVVNDRPMIAARRWNDQRVHLWKDSVTVTFPSRAARSTQKEEKDAD